MKRDYLMEVLFMRTTIFVMIFSFVASFANAEMFKSVECQKAFYQSADSTTQAVCWKGAESVQIDYSTKFMKPEEQQACLNTQSNSGFVSSGGIVLNKPQVVVNGSSQNGVDSYFGLRNFPNAYGDVVDSSRSQFDCGECLPTYTIESDLWKGPHATIKITLHNGYTSGTMTINDQQVNFDGCQMFIQVKKDKE
jgi:hypothetical protein